MSFWLWYAMLFAVCGQGALAALLIFIYWLTEGK
jgi:hypothetical protein